MKKFCLWGIIFLILLGAVGCGDYYYGQVIDEAESGIPEVTVTVNGQEVETTEEGYFSVRNIDEEGVEITIKKEGFAVKVTEVVPDPGTLNLGEYELTEENNTAPGSPEGHNEDHNLENSIIENNTE